MTPQRRATKEDVKTIFCYRGAGFSLDDIADYTGLSRHTVSYQLKKLRYSVDDGDISEVLRSQGLVDNSELIKLESWSSNEISKLAMENLYLQDRLNDSEGPYDGNEPDSQMPEWEENPAIIVIDAINVISVPEIITIDDSEHYNVRFEPSRLKFMIDFLENQGRKVIAYMTISGHSFLLSSKIDEQDKRILVKLENSEKLLVLDDHKPFYRHLDGNYTIVTNDAVLGEYFPIEAQISSYQWKGPEPTFGNLPEMEDHTECWSEELDDQLRAKGLILAMLSQEEYIQLPTIHYLLASEILGLKREEQIKWPKGWAAQLKDKLQLSGKTFTLQLKCLMGDGIAIKGAKVRRVYHDD